jgi:hypothetical protein
VQHIDGLTFQTAVGETIIVTSANQIVLAIEGAPASSPVPAPPAGQTTRLTVNVFFLPGSPAATVTFTGSLGGVFDRTFHKPENDDFQFRVFTFQTI